MDRGYDTTELLRGWTRGDGAARERLFTTLYQDLRRLAHTHRRHENAALPLQTTELVHEMYLRLEGQRAAEWHDRGQFFAVAARMMRRILVDEARARLADKRGGGVRPLPLDELKVVRFGEQPRAVLALEECLAELESIAPDRARLVELRFFVGLTQEEVADALGLSRSTVVRQWRVTKAWLYQKLGR